MATRAKHNDARIERAIDSLTTLRDELRIKLHLAGLDAKENLSWLDEQIFEFEHTSERAMTDLMQQAADASIKKLQALKASLK